MLRFNEEATAEGESKRSVYGVLTDFDLSFWRDDPENDFTRPSQSIAGTPPYMAQESLMGKYTTHLYRHDLESLFYIMLVMCGHYTLSTAGDGTHEEAEPQLVNRVGSRLPRQSWLDEGHDETLGYSKIVFFREKNPIRLSPVFEPFRPWLTHLFSGFSEGFSPDRVSRRSVPFDDETLDGCVDYSTIIEPTRSLKGELEGLIIRYDPKTDTVPKPVLVDP
jgi:hypothetical protein